MYNLKRREKKRGNNYNSIYMLVKLYVEYNQVKIKRNKARGLLV